MKIVYVSDVGREFSSEEECKLFENRYKKIAKLINSLGYSTRYTEFVVDNFVELKALLNEMP